MPPRLRKAICQRSRWIGQCLPLAAVCSVVIATSRPAWPLQQSEPIQQQSENQPRAQGPTLRAEHNEVDVVVTVRDNNGQPVKNLTRNDFEIRDNGKVQTIESFTVEGTRRAPNSPPSGPPSVVDGPGAVERRFVALLFDDVHTDAGDFARVQKAAEQFVQDDLQREDRVAVLTTSGNAQVTFTNDRAKLVAEIGDLRISPAESVSKKAECSRITDYEAYEIANDLDPGVLSMVAERLLNCMCPPPHTSGCPPVDVYKDMVRGSAEESWQYQRNATQKVLAGVGLAVRALTTMPGRRTLVLSSPGFLSADLERDVERLIDAALHGGVVINTLSAKGLDVQTPGGNLSEQRQDGSLSADRTFAIYQSREASAEEDAQKEAMVDFAESTGGRFFQDRNDLLTGFRSVEPEMAYLLAFSPRGLRHDGKFHNLKVGVKAHGNFAIYARKGYFAPTAKEVEAARTKRLPAPQPVPVSSASATKGNEQVRSPIQSSELKGAAASETEATPPAEAPKADVTATNAAPSSPPAGTTSDRATSSPSTALAPQPAATSSTSPPKNSASSSAMSSADAAGERSSELQFLTLASRQVQRYIESFADLTADETREMQAFDEHGLADKKRLTKSALVVYRLRNDPKAVIEFRDVISVDGREVKGHAKRSQKLWLEVGESRSAQNEIRRITADGERFDIGIAETGLTLYEGLPLRPKCAGAFDFREIQREIVDGHAVRVFAYRQLRPCNLVHYGIDIPARLAGSRLVHVGELALDAKTGQIVREERNLYAGDPEKQGIRLAHFVFGYGDSPFGILTPRIIVMERFFAPESVNGVYMSFRLGARLVQTYGPFSKFEVSVAERMIRTSQ